MTEYKITRKIDGITHTSRIKTEDKAKAVETILKQDTQNYPGKRWDSVDAEERGE